MDVSEAVCRTSEVAEGSGLVVRIGDRQIAVFNDGGQYFAIGDRCPHAGASLGVGWIEQGAVVCPLHRWRFRLTDGVCISQGDTDVPVYPCEVREGWVWVSC